MATHWPKPGINHVGEYQVSGHTLVITGSSKTIYLSHVASSITLSNAHASNNLNFTVYDSSHVAMPFTVPNDATARFTGKFLTFNCPLGMSALVEVTNISSASYLIPSASQMHRAP